MQSRNKSYDHIGFLKQEIASQNSYRSVIVLNGQIPDIEFFKSQNLPIIAVDGAASKLVAMGLKPDLVIGDLDSIEPHLINQLNTLHIHDQSYCDFHKTIKHLESINLMPAVITGMEGGMIDHILQNINIFINTHSLFYAHPIIGYILHPGEAKRFTLPVYTKISLFGMPATVTTKGLKWELTKHKLTFPGMNSSFNRNSDEQVFIKVHKGCCLAMIYLAKENDAACTSCVTETT